jgi:hypothetical protein
MVGMVKRLSDREIDLWYVQVNQIRERLIARQITEQQERRDRRSLSLASVMAAVAIAMSGGCALAPNSVRPEIEHISHATQHFGSDTEYGANMLNAVAHWDVGKKVYVELSEGVNVSQHWQTTNSYGDIIGSREIFTARVGYIFTLK